MQFDDRLAGRQGQYLQLLGSRHPRLELLGHVRDFQTLLIQHTEPAAGSSRPGGGFHQTGALDVLGTVVTRQCVRGRALFPDQPGPLVHVGFVR